MLILLVALVVPVATGCGRDAGGGPPPVRVLTAESVSRYQQGSPERAAIEWWRDVQYGNVGGLPDRYAPGAEVTSEELSEQLPRVRPFFESTPRVDSVVERGDRATVYLLALPERGRRQVEGVTVRLTKRAGEPWLLADNLLLERLSEDASSRQGTGGGQAGRAQQRSPAAGARTGRRAEAERRGPRPGGTSP